MDSFEGQELAHELIVRMHTAEKSGADTDGPALSLRAPTLPCVKRVSHSC